MIQGRVVADDLPTGEFTGETGVSQPQCTDDVSCSYRLHGLLELHEFLDGCYSC